MRSPEVLFVAGEASGDRIAAAVLRELDVSAFGLGGDACAGTGAELVGHLRDVTATGIGDVAMRVPNLARTAVALRRAIAKRRPRAALLVDFTELNAPLGRLLRANGVPVLWCVAPQIWAWRSERGPRLRRSMDRLAVLFRFEERLFRALGVDARWVGHPAIDTVAPARDEARRALGIGEERTVALLPGSRPSPMKRSLPAMLDAAHHLRREGIASCLLLAPSLSDRTKRDARDAADRAAVRVTEVTADGAHRLLPAFDGAIVGAGTASLEAALAGVPTVVTYRADPLTALVAKRALRVPHVALPNLLLGARVLPELLQDAATGEALARALVDAMGRDATAAAASLRRLLDVGDGRTTGARTADLLRPWLRASA